MNHFKAVPFDFVLEELSDLFPQTKPMFGAYSVYVENKIVLILRHRPSYPDDNGVWIATSMEHHSSLQQEFPIMRSIKLLGKGPTGWQVLPLESDEFEESVYRVCQLIRRRDPRIGKVPKPRRKAKSKIKVQKSSQKVIKKTLQKKSTRLSSPKTQSVKKKSRK